MDTVLATSRRLHVIQARLPCLLCCYGNRFERTIQIVEILKRRKQFTQILKMHKISQSNSTSKQQVSVRRFQIAPCFDSKYT